MTYKKDKNYNCNKKNQHLSQPKNDKNRSKPKWSFYPHKKKLTMKKRHKPQKATKWQPIFTTKMTLKEIDKNWTNCNQTHKKMKAVKPTKITIKVT